MKKVDLKKELKQFYQASAKEVIQVEMPPLTFLMIDGEGFQTLPKRMRKL